MDDSVASDGRHTHCVRSMLASFVPDIRFTATPILVLSVGLHKHCHNQLNKSIQSLTCLTGAFEEFYQWEWSGVCYIEKWEELATENG